MEGYAYGVHMGLACEGYAYGMGIFLVSYGLKFETGVGWGFGPTFGAVLLS